jgi:hypothetical protein
MRITRLLRTPVWLQSIHALSISTALRFAQQSQMHAVCRGFGGRKRCNAGELERKRACQPHAAAYAT